MQNRYFESVERRRGAQEAECEFRDCKRTAAAAAAALAVLVVCNGRSAGTSHVCRRAGSENGDTEAAGEADAEHVAKYSQHYNANLYEQ